MDTVVHHRTHELRKGMKRALGRLMTPQVHDVQGGPRLAGFLTTTTTSHASLPIP